MMNFFRKAGFSRLKPFWALSRTPHGLLDMTTPAFAALLCLGHFPSLWVTCAGIVTAFAGYTAVYALNDVVDYRVDRERLRQDVYSSRNASVDIDAALMRHPMAQGVISFGHGLCWALSWAAIAVIGAYTLNPFCVVFFLAGCILETVYCLLFKISPMRTLVNGIVKTLGALAAVYAVNPQPSFVYLLTLFFTLFFWEIGGQNIPNDCGDVEEDMCLKARTVPIRFGPDLSAYTVLVTLTGAFVLNFVLLSLSPAEFSFPFYAALAIAGVWLLIFPAIRFYKSGESLYAMKLFNKASWFPPALFLIVLTGIIFSAG
ncbi:MAG: UbiA family prenyltransferase [Desulfococcaceae bacterium]